MTKCQINIKEIVRAAESVSIPKEMLFIVAGKSVYFGEILEEGLIRTKLIASEVEGVEARKINGKALYEIFKTFEINEPVIFEFEKDIIRASTESFAFELASIQADDIKIGRISGTIVYAGSRELSERMKKVMAYAHKDISFKALNSVMWDFNESKLSLISSDSIRMGISTLEITGSLSKRILIGMETMKKIYSILSKSDVPAEITIGERNIKISSGKTEIRTVSMDHRYPDYMKIIPDNFTTKVSLPKKELLSSLQKFKASSKDTITISLKNNVMTIANNFGTVKTNVRKSGEDVEINTDSKALIDGIKNMKRDFIVMMFGGKDKPMIIPDDGFSYVLAV